MRHHRTIIYDWTLQFAAFFAVVFVLFIGAASGALPPENERAIIEEAFHGRISPSLALAVATVETGREGFRFWSEKRRIRAQIAILRELIAQHPDNIGKALARYSKITNKGAASRYVEMVQDWTARFDKEARMAAQSLAAPTVPRRAALDDFDDSIAGKLRRVRRSLDDFPMPRWRG